MKGRLFDKGTFKETFVQLRVAGILFSVIGALTSILYTVGMIIDRVEYNRMVEQINLEDHLSGMHEISVAAFPVEFFYILYTISFLFIPMMVLM